MPAGFFARLSWQESRFDPAALSPAGAHGVAQFIPGTARLSNLVDPFDPAQALARSAEYLRFLKDKFGNLGLAAVAYNGGEGRIVRHVAGGGGAQRLETPHDVMIVTGYRVDRCLTDPPADVDYTLDAKLGFDAACLDMACSARATDFTTSHAGWQPWGGLIAPTASADLARMRFDRAMAQFDHVLGGENLMLITIRMRTSVAACDTSAVA